MKVLIRSDSSIEIGSGHLMRCLTLADQLRAEGADVVFACRDLPGGLFELLEGHGYRYVSLSFDEVGADIQYCDAKATITAATALYSGGFDWLVVDHYGLDVAWERMLRPHARRLMVIDDLANREHDCDLLLDQNYYRDLKQRYQGLVPAQCITLLGPAYVLLRPEFICARRRLRQRDGTVSRILVFFGGSDATNQTQKVLDALRILSRPDILIDVVVGINNPHQHEIKATCNELPNVAYHCQTSNMAELIRVADIAIGAGGATTWERCALGLPTLTVVFADNQLQTTLDLDELGATLFLGWADRVTSAQFAYSIESLVKNPRLLLELSERASLLMKDWLGARAVIDAMNTITKD